MTLTQLLQKFDELMPENWTDKGVSRSDLKQAITQHVTKLLEELKMEKLEKIKIVHPSFDKNRYETLIDGMNEKIDEINKRIEEKLS